MPLWIAPAWAQSAAPAQEAEAIMGPELLLFLAFILLLLSGFFSSSETALFSLQPLDRQQLTQDKRLKHRLERFLGQPQKTLASILAGNELVNVSLSTVVAVLVLRVTPQYPWLNLLVATPLLILFGEVIPKSLALRFRRNWVRFLSSPLLIWMRLIAPVRQLLTLLTEGLIRLMGVEEASERREALQEEDLMRLIDQGRERGTILPVERERISRLMSATETPVSQLMTPRVEWLCAGLSQPLREVLESLRERGLSRLPVHGESGDDIVGILHVKSLLRYKSSPPATLGELQHQLQPVLTVPPTKTAGAMLQLFRERRVHMGLVADEHGMLLGLVTMSDLLQELVGEVAEEVDVQEEGISRIHPDVWSVPGNMDRDDFLEETGIALPEGEYRTLGGFVFTQLGHLPIPGECLEWEGTLFVVSHVESRRITEITIHLSGSLQESST